MRVYLLVLLAGCTEYKLGREEDPPVEVEDTDEPIPEDTDEVPDTDPVDEDCPDEVLPGYAGSTDSCNPDTSGTFTPTLEWSYDAWSENSSSKSVMSTPMVADINDDGLPDIVAVTYEGEEWSSEGTIRALHGDGSGEIWNIVGEHIDGSSPVAIGDLDGDGILEIVAVTYNKYVKCFDNEGNLLWTSGQYPDSLGIYASVPAIADLDADGSAEVIVGSLILNADGTTRFAGTGGKGMGSMFGTSSFAADLDLDGVQELITGNMVYDPDGNLLAISAEGDGYVAVADFDLDGYGDIVVVGDGQVRVYDRDFTLMWATAIPGAFTTYGGPPTVADFDGDGEVEVGVAAVSIYVVFDNDGTMLWENAVVDGSSGVTGSSVFDFEGDGVAEVVYADEENLWVFAGPDGATKLMEPNHSSWTVIEYPVIADVDADGHAEIVVARNIHPSAPSDAVYGIAVFGDATDSWASGRKIWNQFAYSITNVYDEGGIPAVPDANWVDYNNFRASDFGEPPLALPDATIAMGDICEIDCDEGRLVVRVHPANVGGADLPAGAILDLYARIGGAETFVSTVTLDGLPAGAWADSVVFDVQGWDLATFQSLVLYLRTGVEDCDPSNERLRWDGPFCE